MLGVSSNAKQSVNGCCFEHWLLEARRVVPHSRRGGAVGTPPSRLSPIPPPALLGCFRLRSKSALLRLPVVDVSLVERLCGDQPPRPRSHLRRRAGRGNGAKGARLSPCPPAECVLFAVRQGVSVKNHKGKNPPLRFFTDILPLPWVRLQGWNGFFRVKSEICLRDTSQRRL